MDNSDLVRKYKHLLLLQYFPPPRCCLLQTIIQRQYSSGLNNAQLHSAYFLLSQDINMWYYVHCLAIYLE